MANPLVGAAPCVRLRDTARSPGIQLGYFKQTHLRPVDGNREVKRDTDSGADHAYISRQTIHFLDLLRQHLRTNLVFEIS
jgi:hypothetical protein